MTKRTFHRRAFGRPLLRAALLAGVILPPGLAAPRAPAAAGEPLDEAARLIERLDDPRFETRERAAARLDELAEIEPCQQGLAETVHLLLLDANTSFEVRRRLEALLKKLPKTAWPVPPADIAQAQIAELVRQLDADKYAARLGAAARLRWFVTRPELACETMTLYKRYPRLRTG